MWSGVTVWLIVERQTALTLSAAPAIAEQRRRRPQRAAPAPASAIASAPHDHARQIMISPSRRACSSQPVVSAATVAPGRHGGEQQPGAARPGAVDARPTAPGTARAACRTSSPTRSIANEPMSAGLPRTKRSPSRDRAPDPHGLGLLGAVGGCGDIATTPRRPSRGSDGVDDVGARQRRAAAISTPPTPGPTTSVSWYRPKFSASAAAQLLGRDEVGHDRRARRRSAPRRSRPARRRARRARTSGGDRRRTRAAQPAPADGDERDLDEQQQHPAVVAVGDRAAEQRHARSSGTSSTAPSRPVRNAEPVST